MKTPMQELIEQFNEEIARAEQRGDFEIKRILQVALSLANMKLNREKEVMCAFAFRFNHDAFTENYIKAEFEETFNNK